MHHVGTQTLETPRLVLRRLLPEDAPAMYRNWASNPAVTRWLRWEPHKSLAETYALLTAWSVLYQNPDYYQWAIEVKATGEVIGTISLAVDLGGEREAAQAWEARGADLKQGIWEPGYCIGQPWWNQGYTTEALQAVTDYWFVRAEGCWLSCCHAVENPASGAVMRHAGFVYDHDAVYHRFDGTPVDCHVYRLTRADWTAHKRKELL